MKKIIPKVTKAKPQTFQEAKPLSTLRTKLKACHSEIQNYVLALEAENLQERGTFVQKVLDG